MKAQRMFKTNESDHSINAFKIIYHKKLIRAFEWIIKVSKCID